MGSFDHFRRLVEQRKGALSAGQLGLQGRGFLRHGLQGFVKLRQVAHQQEKIAEAQHPQLDLADSYQKYRRRPQSCRQPDDHSVLALDERQAETRAHAFP